MSEKEHKHEWIPSSHAILEDPDMNEEWIVVLFVCKYCDEVRTIVSKLKEL